jgi:hypothetical protein
LREERKSEELGREGRSVLPNLIPFRERTALRKERTWVLSIGLIVAGRGW